MRLAKVICLISLGGLVDSLSSDSRFVYAWAASASVTGFLWGWTAFTAGVQAIVQRILYLVAGRPAPLPATDPKTLAAEVAALNAQIAQLRDTATSFDVSFDETLNRLDERLRRVEQQSPFVQIRR